MRAAISELLSNISTIVPRDIYYAKYYGKRGGGVKLGVSGKMKRGKEKRRKITFKKGGKGLNCLKGYKIKKIVRKKK